MKKLIAFICGLLVLGGCADAGSKNNITRIPMTEAESWLDNHENYVIVDVRSPEEYAEGHIPNAILITNETIGDEPLEQLPSLDQTILVYCRSGRRSQAAALKLAEIGYQNIIDLGGIQDWKGPVIQGSN